VAQHVDGIRGQLLSLLGHLPRCTARPCRAQVARRSKRPPIATYLDATRRDADAVICGVCARGRPASATKALDYAPLLRRLLQIVEAGQVIDAGRTLTLVAPGDAMADVAAALDEHEDTHRSPKGTQCP
jgi:hypothetical protein